MRVHVQLCSWWWSILVPLQPPWSCVVQTTWRAPTCRATRMCSCPVSPATEYRCLRHVDLMSWCLLFMFYNVRLFCLLKRRVQCLYWRTANRQSPLMMPWCGPKLTLFPLWELDCASTLSDSTTQTHEHIEGVFTAVWLNWESTNGKTENTHGQLCISCFILLSYQSGTVINRTSVTLCFKQAHHFCKDRLCFICQQAE